MRYRLIGGCINRYEPEEGWTNIHMDISPRRIWMADLEFAVLPEVIGDVTNMVDFREQMFDEVRMHHVLEHLTLEGCVAACEETFRVLKPGGIFDVEVPDMDRVAQAWVAGEYEPHDLQQWVYGEQLPIHEPGDSHRYGHNWESLTSVLRDAGFEFDERELSGLALRVIARKPG